MECVDLETGELREAEQVQRRIEGAAHRMAGLEDRHARKVAGYLENRAPGLALAMGALRPRLDALAEHYPGDALPLACVIWRLVRMLSKRGHRGQRRGHQRHLLGAYARLTQLLGGRCDALLDAVKAPRRCRRSWSTSRTARTT